MSKLPSFLESEFVAAEEGAQTVTMQGKKKPKDRRRESKSNYLRNNIRITYPLENNTLLNFFGHYIYRYFCKLALRLHFELVYL